MGILQLVDENGDAVKWSVVAPKLTEKDKQEMINQILGEVVQVVDSWETVQKIVRSGRAEQVFKIGDQFECQHSQFGTLKWEIIGINHDTPVDNGYTDSITLQLTEALIFTKTDGTEVPLYFDAPESSRTGSDKQDSHYKSNGSNIWRDSAIRQWLNSAPSEKNNWWEKSPYNNYDAKPAYSTINCFQTGLDEDFLAVVSPVKKISASNTSGNHIETEDKFFLLSCTEVYGGVNNGISEGKAYEYYANHSLLSTPSKNADRGRLRGTKNLLLRSVYRDGGLWNVCQINYKANGQIKQAGAAHADPDPIPACCIY